MLIKVFIIITALLGLSSLMLFLWLKGSAIDSAGAPKKPRLGTIQLDTAELGALSYGERGIIAGNFRGELRIFSSFSTKVAPLIFQLSKSAIIAPVLEKANLYFVGDEDGVFRACDLKNGVKWTYKTGNKISGSAVWCNGSILVGSYDQMLYAFDPETGSLHYKVECGSYINGSPVFSPSENAVFLGSCDGIIRKINAKTGMISGQIDLESPIPASPVLYGEVLYAITHDGDLAAVKAKEFTLLYRVKLPASYTSLPYITDELIFLTDTAGHISVHSRNNGKLLSVMENQEKMTPLQAGDQSVFYAVSTRGKLYEYKKNNTEWSRRLLHDFQTDCSQSCRLFGNSLIIADESGGLYFYEVSI